MQTDQTIEKLTAFRQRDKFSVSAWEARGLNPSDDEMCRFLSSFFNTCADRLIDLVKEGRTRQQLKALLRIELASLSKRYYDTEEREFICDLFYELASIVGVDFGGNLDRWLYGYLIVALMKLVKVLQPRQNAEMLRKACTQCETQLETHVIRKKVGMPETDWAVVKCNNCKELNLLSYGADANKITFINYQWVEYLSMNDYTYEQALIRLEQIKFFRK